jgi:hypothetical protein
MAEFLESIGIEMRAGAVDVPTLFPGSLIDRGSLVIDESKLVAPGDRFTRLLTSRWQHRSGERPMSRFSKRRLVVKSSRRSRGVGRHC